MRVLTGEPRDVLDRLLDRGLGLDDFLRVPPAGTAVAKAADPLYVYAVVHADHDLAGDLAGVTGDEGTLHKVDVDGIAAVVGPAPADLQAERTHLLAHQHVLAGLFTAGTVLPMRFGAVVRDDEALGTVLADRRDDLTTLLQELAGRVELEVEAVHREDVLLQEVLAESRELQQLRDRTRATGSYADSVALDEAVAGVLGDKRALDRLVLLRELGRHAVRTTSGASSDDVVLDESFLVERRLVEEFLEAVRDVQAQHADRIALRSAGPLPPGSFVGGLQLTWS